MANETFNKLINIEVNSKSVGDLNKTLKEIDEEIKSIQQNELKVNQSLDEQEKSLKKISQLEDSRNKITKETTKLNEKSQTQNERTTKNLEAQQKRAESLFKTAEGVGGAFQVAAGASLLLGEQTSEALEKAQAKVVAIISVTDGVKKVAEGAANGYRLVSEGIKKAEIGSKLFGTTTKAAIAATGIGALLIALVLMVEYWDDVSKAARKFGDSIGLTKIIDNIDEFLTKIGGVAGVFTVLGGVVRGYVKEFVNYLQIIGSILTFDIEGIKKNFKEVGSAMKKEVVDAVVAAEKEAAYQRDLIRRDSLIKGSQFESSILKARGKDTLDQEKAIIEETIKLNNIKFAHQKNSAAEVQKFNEELQKNILALEANSTAIILRDYNKRLDAISDNVDKQLMIVNKGLLNETLTISEAKQLQLDIQRKYLEEEIVLRKTKNEDITALLLRQSELNLQIQEAAYARSIELIEESSNLEIIALQEKYLSGEITAKEYQKTLEDIEMGGLEDRLRAAKEGSKEALDIQKEINDKRIQNSENATKALSDDTNKLMELYKWLNDQEIAGLKSIVANTKLGIGQRIEANEKLRDKLLLLNEETLNKTKSLYGEDSLEYKKAAQEKLDIEKQFQDSRNALIQQGIQQAQDYSDKAFKAINDITKIANIEADAQKAKSEADVAKLQESSDEASENIANITTQAEESNARIQELESSLSTARGERAAILRGQIEEEKANSQGLLKQKNEETKRKIENERKIEAEKAKQEKLDKERKEREQALAIVQAIINTALGVTMALTQMPPASYIMAAGTAIAGAAEIAVISSQKFEDGGILDGPSHSNGGIKGTGRFNNIEVEGGEFIVNKRSTAQYLPLLKNINNGLPVQNSNKFEEGGMLPNYNTINSLGNINDVIKDQINKPIMVSVQEINDVNSRVKAIENDSSF